MDYSEKERLWRAKYSNKGIDYLLQLAIALEGEKDELEDRILRIVRGDFAQICSYCGWESKGSGWEELQEHIKTCSKHPLSKVRRQTIEEIIDMIAGGSFLHDQAPPKLFANELIRAIKSKFDLSEVPK